MAEIDYESELHLTFAEVEWLGRQWGFEPTLISLDPGSDFYLATDVTGREYLTEWGQDEPVATNPTAQASLPFVKLLRAVSKAV